MINSIIDSLNCPACNNVLEVNEQATYIAYQGFTHLPVYEVSSAVEEMLNRFMVYTCVQCGAEYRYTFKEIERRLRMEVMKRVLNGVLRGEIPASAAHGTGALFYCGKCTGYDGQGSCPRRVLDKCEIKRLPYVL